MYTNNKITSKNVSIGKMDLSARVGMSQLTPREKEIMKILILGLKIREVASKLNISFHTANNHTKNIYKKLRINSRIILIKKYGLGNVID